MTEKHDKKTKGQTIKVKVLKFHTREGKTHEEGSTYEVDVEQLENLVGQGLVKPVDEGTEPPPA